MEGLGFFLFAFVCTTPPDVGLGNHECSVDRHGHYWTKEECFDRGAALKDELEAAGVRVVRRGCRTPMPEDAGYRKILAKRNSL